MAIFKRNITTSGKFKGIVTNGECFIDDETGELIPLAKILYDVYGDTPFDLSASQKLDEDLGGDQS